MFITKLKLSNLITYMGIAFSLMAIFCSFDKNINLAFMCFMLSGVCDMFDGTFARKFTTRNKKEIDMGIQLDSLTDVVSFLIVPVCIYMAIGMDEIYHCLWYILYVIMGISRLGYFNIYAAENRGKIIKEYRGLAVTYSSLIMPVAYVVLQLIAKPIFDVLYMLVMIIMSVLFVLDIAIPKPSKKGYIFYALLAVVMIFVFIFVM